MARRLMCLCVQLLCFWPHKGSGQIAQRLSSRPPYSGMSMDGGGFLSGMRGVRTRFVALPMRSILVCDGDMTFVEPRCQTHRLQCCRYNFSCFTCTWPSCMSRSIRLMLDKTTTSSRLDHAAARPPIYVAVDAAACPSRPSIAEARVVQRSRARGWVERLRTSAGRVGRCYAWMPSRSRAAHARPAISPRSKRDTRRGRELYRTQGIVARFFNRIRHFDRVLTRYDKLAGDWLAFACRYFRAADENAHGSERASGRVGRCDTFVSPTRSRAALVDRFAVDEASIDVGRYWTAFDSTCGHTYSCRRLVGDFCA